VIPFQVIYSNAKYISTDEGINIIFAKVDGIGHYIPIDESNPHYVEIMRLVDAGELVIEEEE